MHRLGEAELIVEERTKVDLVVVIDALGRVAILDRDREPIVRVHGGQELLVDGDPYVLDIGLEASGARAPQRCRDGATHQDAAIGALQAQDPIHRSCQLEVGTQDRVVVPQPQLACSSWRLVQQPRDVDRDHGRAVASACSCSISTGWAGRLVPALGVR